MHHHEQRIALVTGASSEQDMGTAICKRLAEQGYDIVFTYWHAEADWSTNFEKQLLASGVSGKGIEIDLSHPNAAYEVLDAAAQMGTPSVLVNNAAHSTRDGYENLDARVLDMHYAVNMRTTFLLCTEFARRFSIAQLKAGRIINLTSGQDVGPMPGELAYSATKGAISAFTRALSIELGPLDITVNAVNPGPTDTTWMTDEIRSHLLPKFAMGRIGQPDDAARLIAFLVSDEAQWMTGQILHSEGGFQRS
ncbi:SDR family oxidoreductase [Marinicrinis sediminis]|uniref:SDR family oxidoreductase n=1 Tax=Marinicrinis sediminis TaxID=1652465 RepID=A0ABW5RFL2_9BACL